MAVFRLARGRSATSDSSGWGLDFSEASDVCCGRSLTGGTRVTLFRALRRVADSVGVAASVLAFGLAGLVAVSPAPAAASQPSCTYTAQSGAQYHTLQSGRAIGMALPGTGTGYWIATDTGPTFTCNMATTWGSLLAPPSPVVAVASPPGGGLLLATAAGGVYAFGGATGHGSIPAGTTIAKPIVGMAVDPATGGYWLVGADGGVFSFDAPFLGSMGGQKLDAPVVGISSTPDSGGYRMVAADGGVFDFGNAAFKGSAA